MDLKQTLKTIKLHEEKISMVFGVLILILAGIFVIRYITGLKNTSPVQKADTTTTQNSDTIHIVAKGETLWSISENYYKNGTDWKKIADANNIADAAKLEVGQKLTIPLATPVVPVNTESPAPINSPSPMPQISQEAASTSSEILGANYTVVKGDTLWNIAVRAYGDGYQWVKIARENHLTNPNVIHKGNVFIIPR